MAHTKVTKNGSQNTGTANTFSYSGSFDVFKSTEVKVDLDSVALTYTASTINESASPREYTVDITAKTVHIGGANLSASNSLVIRPFTDMGAPTPRATYTPGASITSDDLNNNQLQLMRKAMEYDEQKLSSTGGTMTGDLTMGEDTIIIFEGATDDAHETTLTVTDPTADRTITLPNVTGTVVTTGDTATVTATMMAANSVDSSELVDGSIDTSHIGNDQVTTDKLASDSVTSAKLADNAVDSEHYTDGSIDTAHIGAAQVTAAKLADDSVTTAKITDGNVTTAKIAADAITAAKIADDVINSEHYVDGSIDTAHIADSQVTTAKIAADAITGAKIADDAIDSEHYVDGSIDTAHIGDNQVTTAKIADSNITTAKIADDAVTGAKIASETIVADNIALNTITGNRIADDAITSGELAADSVGTSELKDNAVETANISNSNVTLAKVTDVSSGQIIVGNGSNRPTAVAMSGDVAIAAGGATTIQSNAVEIGMIGCEQTTISDSDSHIPTSGAVVDYVAAQIAPIGGLEVIADDESFPNTIAPAGVVISITDAAGLQVNSSGVSTNADTLDNSTVTINGFPSELRGGVGSNADPYVFQSGAGLMVKSTGSSQTYDYHQALIRESDFVNLSDDINDFNNRYRIASSAPGSDNDEGDLYFNTSTNKMNVYDGSAWGEVTSTGDYKLLGIKDNGQAHNGTGPTFNGSNDQYDLFDGTSDASITSAGQLLVVLNGVLQKPNASYDASGEGFALDGTDGIRFCDPPASGSTLFVTQIGTATTINVPADNSVTSAKIQDGAVATADIAADAVTGAKIADDAIDSEHYTDGSIDAAHIASNAVTTAKINADAVTGAKIADDAIDSEHYVTDSIDHEHLANDCVDGSNIQDDSIDSEHIAAGAVDLEHMSSQSVDEDNLHISNAGTNGQFLQKQSGNSGGLTWATATAQDTLSFRNLVVNGAMNIAQRGTSASGGSYKTVDRIQIDVSGHEEYPTQSQESLSDSDTGPWAKGFKKFYRITNGNQTGGAGAGEHVIARYKFEAQDIANSAWECANTNSYLTVSFWVRASVAQTYYVNVKTEDGTAKQYSFAYTPSANTWLKVEHSIPGHADLQFDSNNALGLTITFFTFSGVNNTHSGASNNSWRAYDAGTLTLDQTSTWYTTNDATWDLTGLQVEAGDTATEFEHRSFADELERCQRYYYHIPAPIAPGSHASFGNGYHFGLGFCNSTSNSRVHIPFPTTMRTNPASVEWSGTQGDYAVGHGGSETTLNGNISFSSSQAHNSRVNFPCSGLTAGDAIQGMGYNGSAFLGFEAEL